MAALSCPGKMAAISAVSASEQLAEYVQVVVGEDGGPGQVVVVQDADGTRQIQASGLTPEFLQNIAHTDTVFYVQPDGSLVPGGTLAEETVRAQVSLAEEAAQHEGGLEEEAAVATHTPEDGRTLPLVDQAPIKVPTPDPEPREASQQLRTVAHHVAMIQGDSNAVTRLLNHKQLKSICVQVPSHPPKNSTDEVTVHDGQSVSDHSSMSSANPSRLGAQIVQIKSATEPAQRFLVNSASSESPFHILIRQTQLPSTKGKTQDSNGNSGLFEPIDEQRVCAAHPQNGSHTCSAEKPQKKGQKRKKAVKIKTRSGRISRPPKHKAKDYKFLKVGDLIQGSSSDSEDFSELSTDDEEGCRKESAPSMVQPCTVKNSLFQCETCEKSYMGKGGLSRHYRLYPSHGQIDSQLASDAKKNGDTGVAGQSVSTEPKKPVPRPRKRLLEDPLNPTVAARPTLARDGIEFVPLPSGRRGRRPMPGRRFGRPRKILAPDPNEQTAPRVVELIEQCDDTDIKGQVAPSFAKLLSVYDFLLIKVKQDHPDKPLFPHVYKQFEKLHSMVKVLAQEYISTIVLGTEKLIEVTDSKVAESLGISEEMIVRVSPAVPSIVTEEQKIESEENECSGEELAPPSKRLKVDEAEIEDAAEPVTHESTMAVCEEEASEGQTSQGDMDITESCTGSDLYSNATSTISEQVIEMARTQSELVSCETQSELVSCETQSELVSCETQSELVSCETQSELVSCETQSELVSCQTQSELVSCETQSELVSCQTQSELVSCQTQSELVSCQTQQRLLETPQSLLNISTGQSCDNSYNILCELPEDLSVFQTPATHEDTRDVTSVPELSPELISSESSGAELLLCNGASSGAADCPQMVETIESLPTAEPAAEETYSVTSHLAPTEGHLIHPLAVYSTDNMAADQCANAFDLSHEHELVFIDSAEETITEEAVMIFANSEAANTHLDTVVALVEM